ncbi:hypothetical protein GIB67_039005 [Kingdonia uniflora]|uniref:Pre-mRNA-processing factor 39 n=1 Tax=Kingdonia uniflora TaxID=39325 RepID=A0A7J7P743_9MAGN|nr:hypothetical protein GIB67_039005 [Kingdonia uniflora]
MEIFNQSELPGDHDQVVLEEDKLTALLLPCPTDFDGWTSLIAKIEKTSPDDIEKISLVYDSFLSEFPLCYGYWKKFAGHKARLCTVGKVVEVYEQAVRSATYSVDLWVDYCSFSMLLFEDPVDIRRLFERGISFVGKDYLCHLLWDKYIEFEYSQKQWSFLAHIYLRTLKFPTRKLHNYYDSFKKLATIWEEQAEFYTNGVSELPSVALSNAGTRDITAYGDPEISVVIKDILNPALCLDRHSALQKYLFIGEEYYLKAGQIEAKIHCFESRIRRSYFHVKPLDISQLENWHQYLEFVEVQGDFDWTVKIYERCLIPCAGYPEFWMRYVNFVETWGGREIAVFALARAAQIYVKKVPEMHRFIAIFKEKIGDVCGSRAAYRHFDSNLGLDFIENVKREANLEKRQGNCARALNIYEKAIERAKEIQSSNILSILYVNFSRFKYTTVYGTNDVNKECDPIDDAYWGIEEEIDDEEEQIATAMEVSKNSGHMGASTWLT